MKNEINTGMIMDNVSNTNDETTKNVIDSKNMMQSYIDYKNRHTPKIREHNIGRNDPCPCGSGLKFKKCCINKPEYNQYIPLTKNNRD